MKKYLQILSSALVLVFIFCVGNAFALSLLEVIYETNYIAPSFNCDADNLSDDEWSICDQVGGKVPGSRVMLAIADNFFSSYYNYAMANAQSADKAAIRKIARQMIKNRKGANQMTDKQCLITGCYEFYLQQAYLNAISDLTDYLYINNKGKYKHLVENIFKDKTEAFKKLSNKSKDPEIGTDRYNVGDSAVIYMGDIFEFLYVNDFIERNGTLIIKQE